MSGHSKWSSIKHQKAITDSRRGKLFTKLTREIIIAVRESGSSPDTNFRLRLAMQKARDIQGYRSMVYLYGQNRAEKKIP